MLSGESDINPYLQQEVLSATPARLRWMLIQRSVDLCGMVAQFWAAGATLQGDQWLLRIREILGELLEGVKDRNNPLSSPISDFYLYLLQLSFEIERSKDLNRLEVLRELLAIESETWRQVIAKVGSEATPATATGVVFPPLSSSTETLSGGSFSLEI